MYLPGFGQGEGVIVVILFMVSNTCKLCKGRD